MEPIIGILFTLLIIYIAIVALSGKDPDVINEDIKLKPIDFHKKASKEWVMPIKSATHIDYETYIKSDKWKFNASRKEAQIRDEFKCAMCGSDYHVEVHHITYDNLGREKLSDLACLCKVCHEYTHKIAGPGAGVYTPLKSPLRT